jgi:hypothetical protein
MEARLQNQIEHDMEKTIIHTFRKSCMNASISGVATCVHSGLIFHLCMTEWHLIGLY